MSDYKLTLQSHNSELQELVNIANELPDKVEGVQLNFEVVGGLEQPTNPTENMIWVNTDVAISGYTFSNSEPIAAGNGKVWIRTGTISNVTFDVVENVKVYPISAQQYISNVWVDVTVKSYQNGAWCDWWRWDDLFNGETDRFTQTLNSSFASAPTKSDGVMHFNWTDSLTNGSAGIVFGTANGVDLSDKSMIRVEMEKLQTTGYTWFIVSILTDKISSADASGNFINTLAKNAVCGFTSMPDNNELLIDVSAYSGIYYIYIGSVDGYASIPNASFNNSYTGSISATVKKVSYR